MTPLKYVNCQKKKGESRKCMLSLLLFVLSLIPNSDVMCVKCNGKQSEVCWLNPRVQSSSEGNLHHTFAGGDVAFLVWHNSPGIRTPASPVGVKFDSGQCEPISLLVSHSKTVTMGSNPGQAPMFTILCCPVMVGTVRL
jgi:hypothetical protein